MPDRAVSVPLLIFIMSSYSIPPRIPFRTFAGPFFCALFLFIWCHGSSIFHFTIIPDEELRYASATGNDTAWLADGRWAIYVLKFVFSSFVINPFYSAILAALAIAGAAAVTYHALMTAAGRPAESSPWSGLVLSALLVTCPLFAFVLTFSTFDSEIGAAFLLAVVSAVCSFNTLFGPRRHLAQLGAAGLLLVSFSVYQPMLIIWGLLTTALLIAFLVFHPDPARPPLPFRRLAYVAVAPVLALAADKLIKMVLFLYVPPNGYVDQFFGWAHSSPREVVASLATFWHGVLSGDSFSAGAGWRVGLVLGAAAVAFLFSRAVRSPQRFTSCWLVGAFCVLPFALSFALGGQVPLRTLFPFSLALALPPFLACLSLSRPLARTSLVGLTLLVALLNAQWINHAFISDYRRYAFDRFVGEQIGLRLSVLRADSRQTQLTVVVVGELPADATIFGFKHEVIGASLFEWESGNPYRIVAFLRALGFGFIAGPTQTQLKQAIELSRNLNAWPATESVKQENDFVIVKLSDATPQQIAKYGR
jgi:hypothetical protein